MTNRILPETLPALYRKHGVVPIQEDYCELPFSWEDFAPCACGLGISYYAATGCWASNQNDDEDVCKTLHLSLFYHRGYYHGFDGVDMHWFETASQEQQADYDLGYADGAAGWEAVKDLAVTE